VGRAGFKWLAGGGRPAGERGDESPTSAPSTASWQAEKRPPPTKNNDDDDNNNNNNNKDKTNASGSVSKLWKARHPVPRRYQW
jgi:hypothetical protein